MASPNSRPKEVDVTKKPDIEVSRPAEVNPTKIKPEMETKVKPDIDAAAASASAVPKVKAQEPDLPKAGQPEVTPDAGKKVQKPEEVDTEATKAGKVEEEDTNWGPDEISRLREDWGVPETDTLAVAKTDIEGLEDIVFKGGSPRVRKEAGLDEGYSFGWFCIQKNSARTTENTLRYEVRGLRKILESTRQHLKCAITRSMTTRW